MTVTVNTFVGHIGPGMKAQLVRRFPATGNETILVDGTTPNQLETQTIWHGCELVIREVEVPVEEVKVSE